jgi:hypothetical protein
MKLHDDKLLAQLNKATSLTIKRLKIIRETIRLKQSDLVLPAGRYGRNGSRAIDRIDFLLTELNGLEDDCRQVLCLPPKKTDM